MKNWKLKQSIYIFYNRCLYALLFHYNSVSSLWIWHHLWNDTAFYSIQCHKCTHKYICMQHSALNITYWRYYNIANWHYHWLAIDLCLIQAFKKHVIFTKYFSSFDIFMTFMVTTIYAKNKTINSYFHKNQLLLKPNGGWKVSNRNGVLFTLLIIRKLT